VRDEPKVEAALRGIHAAVIALIVMATYRMAKAAIIDVATACVTAAALLILLMTNINPFHVILIGLVVGPFLVKGKELLGIETRTERADGKGASGMLEPEYFI